MVETLVSLVDSMADNHVTHKLDTVSVEVQSKISSLWKKTTRWQNRKFDFLTIFPILLTQYFFFIR